MTVKIIPQPLGGRIMVPPSKSLAHRALIAAALSGGESVIRNPGHSQDIGATERCLTALGARFRRERGTLTVDGGGMYDPDHGILECGESGSTLRFLLPVVLARGGRFVFRGEGRLMERPLGPFFDIFGKHGISYSLDGDTLTVEGRLDAGSFELPGDVSSQFVSGLLFALPMTGGEIVLSTPPESAPYIGLTLDVLASFGVSFETEYENNAYKRFRFSGKTGYTPCEYTLEGDYSQAAFWLVVNALGGNIMCMGLNPDSRQGDAEIVRIIEEKRRVVDVSDIPDLAPALAVYLSLNGGGRITGGARLRLKESDRLASTASELNKIGAKITELPDGLEIAGVDSLSGGAADSCGDHRIAMALAVAASRCDRPVVITNADCVDKSYPAFFDHYMAVSGPRRRR